MKPRIALVTDSTCDLPDALVQERRLYMIPQVILWGREVLKDGISLNSRQFYERLAVDSDMPTTSRPAPVDVADLLQRARDENDAEAVVVVIVSADVSGTVSSTQEAMKTVDFPVYMVDTRTISLALGLTVLQAADARDQGASAQEVVELAQRVAARSRVMFTPGTLEYLYRGGRIGGARHLIGTALSIKPILHLKDGRVEALENVRTRKRALKRLVEILDEQIDRSRPMHIGVMHGNAAEEAEALAAEIRDRLNPAVLLQSWVSPSIGVHAGPGVIGLAML